MFLFLSHRHPYGKVNLEIKLQHENACNETDVQTSGMDSLSLGFVWLTWFFFDQGFSNLFDQIVLH